MLSDPVAEAFGLIHRHPSGENLWYGVNTGVRNIIDSKTRKMSNDKILSCFLTGSACELCRKPYTSKDPLRHQHTIHGEKMVKYHLCPAKMREKITTLHQRVRTSEFSLNRIQKASEAQLSPKRFNLALETQHSTNLK